MYTDLSGANKYSLTQSAMASPAVNTVPPPWFLSGAPTLKLNVEFCNLQLLILNPLSPNIHKQILQTDLYTFL